MPSLPGLPASAPAAGAVKVKVPAGLPDPGAYVPPANPMTRAKWQLGRRLFFDESILTAWRRPLGLIGQSASILMRQMETLTQRHFRPSASGQIENV